MKLILFILIVFFIVTCSTQKVSVYEETKLIKIKCSFCENILNTFNDVYTQDVYGEVSTIPFYLSIEEQSEIIAQIENIDYFNLPDTLKTPHTSQFATIEDIVSYSGKCPEKQFCEIEMNGIMKKISWNGWLSYDGVNEYSQVKSLLVKINKIIQSRVEVKQLSVQYIF